MNILPHTNRVIDTDNDDDDVVMNIDMSHIRSKDKTQINLKTLVIPKDYNIKISLSADNRHVANARKATLKRISSPLSDNSSGIKKPTIKAQDSRLLNKYSLESKPPFVVNIELIPPSIPSKYPCKF
ncbi:sphingosine-1-phosphate phosphatase [Lasius niger]|uniref:Sphingosine-1-phosphate phosphatase n=1 Tax=Lasius niger TaxID=67767 RepID=A0A0J7KL38_LASNI|nr:sphingosine-1-phosphate phosphatase [Lasius niger]